MPVHSLYEAHRSSTFVRKYHDYRFADNRNVPPWIRFQLLPLDRPVYPKPPIFQFSKSLGVTFFVASYTFDKKARNRSRERENGVKTLQNDHRRGRCSQERPGHLLLACTGVEIARTGRGDGHWSSDAFTALRTVFDGGRTRSSAH